MSRDEIISIGCSMNSLRDGIFTGLNRSETGFACDVCSDGSWVDHEREMRAFMSEFGPIIRHAIDNGMFVLFDIAIGLEDRGAAVAFVGLSFDSELLLLLGASGLLLHVSVY